MYWISGKVVIVNEGGATEEIEDCVFSQNYGIDIEVEKEWFTSLSCWRFITIKI